MKNIKYLIITLLSLLMVQTATADGTKAYKGVKVTDKNGKVTNHFHVDSIQVYNDTLTVWNHTDGLKWDGDKGYFVDRVVAYEVHYYKPQNVEVYDKNRGLRIFVGDEEVKKGTSIDIYLGLKGSVLTDEDKRWCNTYAMPYSKKFVAKDDDGNILNVEWTTEDPLKATVSPDGSVMGHAPGTTKLKATSLTGETITIDINTKEISHDKTGELEVHSFFPGSEGYKRYFDRYYATGLGVWNSSKCKDFDNAYNKCNLDVNKGLGSGTSDIYVAVNFDKDWDHDTKDYITNVIAVYSTEAVDVSETFTIDGRTYHYASKIGTPKNGGNDGDITDLNDGAGGSCIYLAYTKDEYKRNGEPSYLVSHSALAFYGGDYVHDGNLSDEVKDNKNFTRLIRADKGKVKDEISKYGAEMLNLGSDDEAVKVYSFDGSTYVEQTGLTDFQYKAAEEQWITMVCTYEPYFPPAEKWMSKLDDNTPISTLSIPGTHDSSTANISSPEADAFYVVAALSYVSLIGIPFAILEHGAAEMIQQNLYMGRTQRYGFKDQFRHGVRLFDIRVDASSKNGDLCHGEGFSQKAVSNYTYRSMLKELWGCVENSGEFVILEVKPNETDGNKYTPAQIWKDTYEIVGEGNLIKYHKGLTLGECRGKFLIKGNDSDYVTFSSAGDLDYYELHGNEKTKRGYVGDKSGNIASPLWCSSMEKTGNINNGETRKPTGNPAIKYSRATQQLFNYSTLPADRDTWIYTDLSGYFVGVEGNPSGVEWITGGKFDTQQSSYMNSRIAHYIKGMNGSPCGIVRMDFAGTNYADQDQCLFGSKHIATTYGYYLCQAVIRNNFIGKEINDKDKYYLPNGYATQKDASSTRGSEPVNTSSCSDRTECGWVQLWKDGPKFAEFNVGSSIGTYIGMTSYHQSIVGEHYTYPKYLNEYDRYEDNASLQWGVDWRTPTPDEISALLNSKNTTIEYIDGVKNKYAPGCTLKGYKISGKGAYAANSIFLPAAGIDDGNGKINGEGINGLYWGRNPKDNTKYVVEAKQNGTKTETNLTKNQSYAEKGLSLRPVYEKGKGHAKFKDNRPETEYYKLDNAEDLAAFSAFVNGEEYNGEQYKPHGDVKGKLTQDIDMSIFDENREWSAIGNKYSTAFQGLFDGQNHRIKNHHGRALFHIVGSNHNTSSHPLACKIENVIIDSTCVITGYGAVGGVVDQVYNYNDESNYVSTTIKNCGNEATVINLNVKDWSYTAGILGATMYANKQNKAEAADHPTSAEVRIIDCYNTGKITDLAHIQDEPENNPSVHHYAAINGLVSAHLRVVNCWNSGSVAVNKGYSYPEFSAAWRGKDDHMDLRIVNCYSKQDGLLNHEETITDPRINIEIISDEQMRSGFLCRELNKNYRYLDYLTIKVPANDTIAWFQKIGAEHPTLYSVGNDTVYCNNFKLCDDWKTCVYRNDTTVLDSDIHDYDDNGFCKRDGTHYQPAEKDGNCYFITNAGNLYWFAQQWNTGNIKEDQPTIMLMNHIQDNGKVLVNGQLNTSGLRKWTPIGNNENPFRGSINGRCHVISGLYCVGNNYAGLFGEVERFFWMEGVGVVDSYFEVASGNGSAGALAAHVNELGTFKNCFAIADIKATGGGVKYLGGLIGYCQHSKHEIANCYSLCNVKDINYNPEGASKNGPFIGEIGSERDGETFGYSNCYHNDINHNDDGHYMDEASFRYGIVCDKLNAKADSVFVSQRIGYNGYPVFGNLGVFHVQPVGVEWSSITVPFKLTSNKDVQYYCCTGVDDILDDRGYGSVYQRWVNLKEMDEVKPNTPCFMRYLKYNKETATVEDSLLIRPKRYGTIVLPDNTRVVSIKCENSYEKDIRVVSNVGSLVDIDNISETIEAGKDSKLCYFFKGGTIFYADTEKVKIPAFRSVFFFDSDRSRLTGFRIGKSEVVKFKSPDTASQYPPEYDGGVPTNNYVKPKDGEKITVD